jgi:hypothetical protein
MSPARVLSCAACGAPVSFRAPSCAYCRASLSWDALPELRRGEPVAVLAFAGGAPPPQGLLPNTRVAPGEGLVVDNVTNGSTRLAIGREQADGVAMVRGRCLDAHGGLGVLVRVHQAAPASIGYALRIRPALRAFTVRRFLTTAREVFHDVLRPWETVTAIGGVGATNEIELRYGDSVLHVLVNGAHLDTLVDACFGYGATCWEASAYEAGPSRVVIERAEQLLLG